MTRFSSSHFTSKTQTAAAFAGVIISSLAFPLASPAQTNDPELRPNARNAIGAAAADIAISKTATPDPVVVNETLTYAVTVTNQGPDDANSVAMFDTLPPGTDFVSATATQGTCSHSSGTVMCDLGALFAHPAATPSWTARASSPEELTCIASDPATGLIYGQADRGTAFYRYVPSLNVWQSLAPSPLYSGDNGGATVINGKCYTIYTSHFSMGIYDIASDTWSTTPFPDGTANVCTDGTYLYVISGNSLSRYTPGTGIWTSLASCPINTQPWSSSGCLNGYMYVTEGNGNTGFARYDIGANTWKMLPSVPGGVVLGGALDPVSAQFYTYGSYGGNKLYRYDIPGNSWQTYTIPVFAAVNDGGMAFVPQAPARIYVTQGEAATGFATIDLAPRTALCTITVKPTTVGVTTNIASASAGESDPDDSNNTAIAVTNVIESPQTMLDDQFTTSNSGWQQFGTTGVTQYAGYDSNNASLMARITQSTPDDYRIIGWITDPANALPYAAVGSDHFVRAKYYVYADNCGTPANEIPNFRIRIANRFAVTALQKINNHFNADPEATNISYDIRPSTSPGAPSVYRVDLDPIDVPQLVDNPATERFLRAIEVYEPDPQANGIIGLTECAIVVYSRLGDYSTTVPVTQNGLIKRFQPGASNGGEFGTGDAALSNSAAVILKLHNGVSDTSGPQPSFSVSNAGVTLETLNVESDRFAVAAFDVFNDLADQTNHRTRARVEPGKQYKVRFHATSTKATNTQSVIRFRARTIRFEYTASLEVGGATGASIQSNTIAAQALPGIGNQIPASDRINPTENGGWYSVLMVSPMNSDIQASQPNLFAQDGPGADSSPSNDHKSRRDLQFGFDVIDTFSTRPTSGIEAGQMTVDRVEIEKYDLVPD